MLKYESYKITNVYIMTIGLGFYAFKWNILSAIYVMNLTSVSVQHVLHISWHASTEKPI